MKSLLSGLTGLLLLAWSTSYALDPPHDNSNNINCINCHTPHGAPGGSITREAGNPNLCMTCHTPGGLATNRPFNDVDQARPGVSGFSHRWDWTVRTRRATTRKHFYRQPAVGRRL
jgi:predicted CXXCH cytochrome family protein